jgi:protein SCO1/2
MACARRLFFILKIMIRHAVAPSAITHRAVWKRTVGPKARSLRSRLVMSLLCAMLGAIPVADIAAGERGSQPGAENALATSQAAIGREIGDYVFTTTLSRPLRLSDYRGKPVVLNLVYTSCADICPTVSETLARAVAVGQDMLGSDSFRVVSVGFDARNDTPQRMQAFVRRHGLQLPNWDFLSADPDTIDGLSRDVGFLFWPGPQGFNHLSQTTIIDSEGRVYRQVYGTDFDPPLLVQPLKELILGRRSSLDSFEGLWTKVRLICTVYDPASSRYRFSYAIFIGAIVGAICLGAVGAVLARLWWRNRHADAVP